jgi:hypothetical protein
VDVRRSTDYFTIELQKDREREREGAVVRDTNYTRGGGRQNISFYKVSMLDPHVLVRMV